MRAHRTADWLFCFAACTIVLLSKSEISSHGCTSCLCQTRRGRLSLDVACLSALRFLPLNIDCDKLRNTGLNILVVNWSFFS